VNQPIAILNLTRLGDILLTLPMLHAIRKQQPGHPLHLIVAKGFEQVASLLPVDETITLDPVALSRIAAHEFENQSLATRVRDLSSQLDTLLTTDYHLIYNLTHSMVSAVLASRMRGRVVAGLYLDKRAKRRMASPVDRYFFAGNLNRGINPIHLSDLHLLGLRGSRSAEFSSIPAVHPSGQARRNAKALLKGLSEGGGATPVVAIQVAASTREKQWEAEAFGETGRRLAESIGAKIVLTGTSAESESVMRAARIFGDAALSLAGKTDLETLAAVLQSCDLLITNDTGTMHLAQVVGTKCLVINLGSALSDETGPINPDNLIIEPDIACFPCSFHVRCPHFNCHSLIKPELVAHLAEKLLVGPMPESGELSEFSGVHIWRTSRDDSGYWRKLPLTRHRQSGDRIQREILRVLLPDWLTGEPIDLKMAAGSCAKALAELYGAPTAAMLESLNSSHGEGLAGFLHALHERVEDTRLMRQYALDAVRNINRLTQLADKVERGIEELTRTHLSNPILRPLLLLFRFERENLPDGTLEEQLAATESLYRSHVQLLTSVQNVIEALPEAWSHAAVYRSGTTDWKQSTAASQSNTAPINGSDKRISGDPYARFQRPRMRQERLSVILLVSGYYLQEEIGQALRNLGHRVLPLTYEDRSDVIERLLRLSLEADLLITVNHLGFDQSGELGRLLKRIGLPIVSWYVDRPGFILLDHIVPTHGESFVFTWEKATLRELEEYGFQHIHYLPLATDIDRFSPDGAVSGRGRLRWVANSNVAGSRDWRTKANIDSQPMRLFDRAVVLQRSGRIEPLDALEAAARAEGVSLDEWSKRERLQYASALALTATRDMRAELARSLASLGLQIYGDPGWHELATEADWHPAVSYYGELPEIYRKSIHLNTTSYQMPGAVNQRVFDVPAAGGILITDDQEALHECFAEDECFVFSQVEEVESLLDRIERSPRETEKKVALAMKRIHEQHTYNHRVASILETVRKSIRKVVPVAEGGRA